MVDAWRSLGKAAWKFMLCWCLARRQVWVLLSSLFSHCVHNSIQWGAWCRAFLYGAWAPLGSKSIKAFWKHSVSYLCDIRKNYGCNMVKKQYAISSELERRRVEKMPIGCLDCHVRWWEWMSWNRQFGIQWQPLDFLPMWNFQKMFLLSTTNAHSSPRDYTGRIWMIGYLEIITVSECKTLSNVCCAQVLQAGGIQSKLHNPHSAPPACNLMLYFNKLCF